ncbi:MAG: hypothetical protein KA764_22970 [Anaerolineales bacterium]|nr:hypothetical protein [Anaerolineales bacterium]
MRNERQGCLAGLLELFLLNRVFDWLQARFGFGRGCSCTGCGCGVVLTLIWAIIACGILTGTDWTKLFGMLSALPPIF